MRGGIEAPNKYIQFLEMIQNKATHFVSNLKGRDGVTNVSLQRRRPMQRVEMLHNIMESSDPSVKELNNFIDTYFIEDCSQMRAKSHGQPLAIFSSRDTRFK